MRMMTDKEFLDNPPRTPAEIVRKGVDYHNIDSLYVGLSGGKDSSVVAHFAAENFPELFKGCIFCDTGIAVKEAKEFVISYCKEMGYGFPGPNVHTTIMRHLKYIPMRELIRSRIELGERPAILSGVRKQESVRRGINASDEVYRDGKMIFISPMLYKSDSWMYAYYTEHKLKRSPVYDTLHISGDCLCGCFSKPGEAKLLDIFHKPTAKQIHELEEWMRENFDGPNHLKTWGKQAGMTHAGDQDTIDKFLCNDCYFDRKDDSKQTLDELDEIDAKLRAL
jgi:3'-phosphoadenosine 5'-phosphosulfate sulfotransferase (PAPS reductase)/FAD synthetase